MGKFPNELRGYQKIEIDPYLISPNNSDVTIREENYGTYLAFQWLSLLGFYLYVN